MSETGRCPYCGSSTGRGATEPAAVREAAAPGEDGLESLYREVRRIREIAEARAAGDDIRRIAELTREVLELRATVARLRGPGIARLPAPAEGEPGRRAG
jgi:hypothetical protein